MWTVGGCQYALPSVRRDDVTHNVEADSALGVDVGVVDLCLERDLFPPWVSWVLS